MTLIIAGYEHSKSLGDLWGAEKSVKNTPSMDLNGLFIVADSAITAHSGGRTLLNGFKKVHCIEAKLWKPYFLPDGSFKDYMEVCERKELFIGFAGSTLTAQHIINSITEHLGNLRISYERNSDGSIKYKVIRHCQRNPLLSDAASYWDDETFRDRDFEGLLTGEVIAENIEYSMNDALRSAGRYKFSMEEFIAMYTEIVSGVWCQSCARHELYVYRMQHRAGDDGVLIAYTQGSLIPAKSVVVLGMRRQFESCAQREFDRSMQFFSSPADAMYKFLNDSIDQVQLSGSREIDRPASYRKLERDKISMVK